MDRPPLIFCECCGRGLPIRSALTEEQPHRCPRCGRSVCRACLHSGFHLCLTCLRQAAEDLNGKCPEPHGLPASPHTSQICPSCHRLICDHCWSKLGFPRCGDCSKTSMEAPPSPPPPSQGRIKNKLHASTESMGFLLLTQMFLCLVLVFIEPFLPRSSGWRIILPLVISVISLVGLCLILYGKRHPPLRP